MTLHGDRLVRAAAAAARLADALATALPTGPRDQSLAAGAAGVALLHTARGTGSSQAAADAWLRAATREGVFAGAGAGLWFGAPALAFALTAAPPGCYQQAAQRLDETVDQMTVRRLAAAHRRIETAQCPERTEYDLVSGLTGLGAYLLLRHPGGERLRQVLAYLVRLAEPLPTDPDLPGWWSRDVPRGEPPAAFADGHADFGMAHGIAGPLALLALAYRAGVTVPGQLDALDRICGWLDTWRQPGHWWPERITAAELQAGRPDRLVPGRASWCYGAPGLARAQQLAAAELRDPVRQERAEAGLAACLTDQAQLDQLPDPALCHGWTGVLATVRAADADARFHPLGARLPGLLDQLLDHLETAQAAGWKPPGLIEGTAGIAAVLHGLATGTRSTWETALLLDLP
ncbi:lanthionine synthetase C family protein [Pseudofrankia asymbiotica]|uniref:Lanthionine synthetase n=1 Tax=Pseudofrankia asymbiotica TaxID=1834516 RepID=A0A1V2IKC1_9ACTN|nr:lanthionine synthetase C family protein [Pseudofrankia asymbiotica]ONH33608.1 lanthionine synthetase [Pseudofrankia asymbiotica]